MKSFIFKSPTNTKEAAKLASGRAAFLAGGMSLLPAIKLRLAAYSDLINIKKIKGLSGIKVSSKSLRIGATTTHAEVSASKEVGKSIPSLAVLAEGIGDPQVRNRGTIGGSIANNDPAADYPSACLALNSKSWSSVLGPKRISLTTTLTCFACCSLARFSNFANLFKHFNFVR